MIQRALASKGLVAYVLGARHLTGVQPLGVVPNDGPYVDGTFWNDADWATAVVPVVPPAFASATRGESASTSPIRSRSPTG